MPYSMCDQLVAWLKEALSRKSPRTVEQYVYVTKKLFAVIGDVDLAELKPMHLRRFYKEMSATMSQNSLHTFDIALRAIFSRVEREGKGDFGLPRNWQSPLKQVEREAEIETPKQPLSKTNLDDLLATMPRRGFTAQRNYALLSFLVMTGARQTEARFACISNLDLDKRVIDLKVTKGGRPRFVFLPHRLVRVLATYLRRRTAGWQHKPARHWRPGMRPTDIRAIPGDLLFPTRSGGPIARTAVTRLTQRACSKAKVPVVGPHRLRHSFITHTLNDGAPLKFVQDQVGHRNVKTTMRYNHVPAEVGVELADKFSPLR